MSQTSTITKVTEDDDVVDSTTTVSIFPYSVNIILFIIAIILILIIGFITYCNYYNIVPTCTGEPIIDGINPLCSILGNFVIAQRTVELGGQCTNAAQCIGYSFGGRIDCCGGRCVEKNEGIEPCLTFCVGNPDLCGAPLCNYCVLGTDCSGFTIFGSIECINNRCIRKDYALQTVPEFLSIYGSVDAWCESISS